MIRVLLADDPSKIPALRTLAGRDDPSWDYVIAPMEQHAIWQSFGPCTSVHDFEAIGQRTRIDEVILAGTSQDLRLLASRMASSGAKLIVLPDVCQTAEWAYSLFPIDEDSPGLLRPAFLHRTDPVVMEARQRLAASPPGNRPHLICHYTPAAASLAKEEIAHRLLADCDLFRFLCGEFDQLTAVPVTKPDGEVISQTVTLSGVRTPTISWLIQAANRFSWTLASQAEDSPFTLAQNAEGEWTLDGEKHVGNPGDETNRATWNDLLRAFDYVAAAERSIRRRRTVGLQAEALSEKAQFKTLMSATGCGLLLYTMFGVVALLVAGAAFDPRDHIYRASDAAGLVFTASDFEKESPDSPPALTEDASLRLNEAIPRLHHSSTPILIEKQEASEDAANRGLVIERLDSRGIADPQLHVEIHPLEGRWFAGVMKVVWTLLFLPLGIFLIGQFLISIASEPRDSAAPPSTG